MNVIYIYMKKFDYEDQQSDKKKSIPMIDQYVEKQIINNPSIKQKIYIFLDLD